MTVEEWVHLCTPLSEDTPRKSGSAVLKVLQGYQGGIGSPPLLTPIDARRLNGPDFE